MPPPGRGSRGAASSSGTQDQMYTLADPRNVESSPDADTGTLLVFLHKVNALIDPGSILSYVPPLIVANVYLKGHQKY